MYFHKIHHPTNFASIDPNQAPYSSSIRSFGNDCWRVVIEHPDTHNVADMIGLIKADYLDQSGNYSLDVDEYGINITDTRTQNRILTGHSAVPIGVCGSAWLFSFNLDLDMHFYGMGEKNIGFEKSGIRTKFWNTDVWADFSWWDIEHGSTDPMYASFPVMLIKKENLWIALMVPTSTAVFMDTGAPQMIEGAKHARVGNKFFYLGAIDGYADLIITVGATAKEVASKLTRTLGLPPVPPLWALGHHQSRWGYGTFADAAHLDAQFTEHDIPCDAVWFDIDYMDEYRVFTSTDEKSPQLDLHGRKIVAILDPGVKVDDYPACNDGLDKDIFCYNSQKKPYVGFVWPGASHFPDFSLSEGRQWWATQSAMLAKKGFDSFWIDMNDPSTGSMEVEEMRFNRGLLDHHLLHNHYALGMAKATEDGLKAAYPERRPFVLTRSAMLGSHLYGALWTGDSMSNYHHLRKTVEMILSLSLSTMAFTGSDVGGFGGNTDAELLVDWYRTCMLFPVMRNHSADGTHRQEPWEFGLESTQAIRSIIRMRYALLPYLYNQMLQLHLTGEPVIRPMLYDNNDTCYETEASQFTIGEALLQAPKLERGQTERTVLIPEGKWLDLQECTVIEGPCEISVDLRNKPLALYLKQGCFVPIAALHSTQIKTTADIDISSPTFLFFPGDVLQTEYQYLYDEGDGYGEMKMIEIVFTSEKHSLSFSINGEQNTHYSLAIAAPEGKRLIVNGKECQGVPWQLPFADALNGVGKGYAQSVGQILMITVESL
ncbi:MAG: glycoside hydrolase family 31 protein [Sphaerochaetaceae bacterium]